jgi:hypothetical protein
MPMSPHKFDEVFLKVTALGDDIIQVVRPDNQNPFVALSTCEQKLEKNVHKNQLTMKAPHCSLSARGKSSMVSRI